jgi:dynein heavy chain
MGRIMRDQIFDEMELAPGFRSPHPGTIEQFHSYIDDALPADSPHLFGLHPNAEIGFMTQRGSEMLRVILNLQPRTAASDEDLTPEQLVALFIEDTLDKLPENYAMSELYGAISEDNSTPFTAVCLQECERMNALLSTLKRSLVELRQGLNGELAMTEKMENLLTDISLNVVPPSWRSAYASLRPLGSWLQDLHARISQLTSWAESMALPRSVALPLLSNPASFLRAVMQATARKNQWPLDAMALQTDVTKKTPDQITAPPREGAYIHGLYLEGAKLDPAGVLAHQDLKELHVPVNVIYVRSVLREKLDQRDIYICPAYATLARGPTYIFGAFLKTKADPNQWTLAGAALIGDVVTA